MKAFGLLPKDNGAAMITHSAIPYFLLFIELPGIYLIGNEKRLQNTPVYYNSE